MRGVAVPVVSAGYSILSKESSTENKARHWVQEVFRNDNCGLTKGNLSVVTRSYRT